MERQSNALERHVQTILVSLIAAGIGYVVSEQINAGKINAHASVQINYLIQQIGELRSDIKTMQGNYVRSDQFIDHETRLRSLETKVK